MRPGADVAQERMATERIEQSLPLSITLKPEDRVVIVSPIKEALELANQSLNDHSLDSNRFSAENRATIGQIIGQSRVVLCQSIPGRAPGSFQDQQPMLFQLAQVIAGRPF